jgi:hypothetical protein
VILGGLFGVFSGNGVSIICRSGKSNISLTPILPHKSMREFYSYSERCK